MENSRFGLIWIFVILAAALTYNKLTGNGQISWTPIILLIGIPLGIAAICGIILAILDYVEEKKFKNSPAQIRMRKERARMEEYDEKFEEYMQRCHDENKEREQQLEEQIKQYEQYQLDNK